MMKLHSITDSSTNQIVCEMPVIVWWLIEFICKYTKSLLGGHIMQSYTWDYACKMDKYNSRTWRSSLWSGILLWWDCRRYKP